MRFLFNKFIAANSTALLVGVIVVGDVGIGVGVGAGIGLGFELSLLLLPPPPQAVNEVANSVNMIARLKKLFDSSVSI